ncbi:MULTISPECIES: DUF4252 domain-containing protein [unclassified Dysgonomonas]|uniref:DUF4252 domain-containing protein n=1 Tax=unclassified Dysgonomonas TaxID=2630389 RepID=UPI0006822F5E|nr:MULTISPECIES: DUF4252 domain-containing protein [unclassified Dysgonomonas]MBD8347113.1 DUF4252 domain-containing protein [Dysgonomonas sp. HGC4]MBF0574866.1 DUF4252 domain-containing protein [Dysgonomonas sp. GY617]
MKKLIFSIFLVFATSQIISAQDLSNWVSGLALNENAQYQQVDRTMIEASLAAARIADSSAVPQTPPFMEKLESIDVINLTECSAEIKKLFLADLEGIKDENGYETLINVVDGSDKVRIVARKEGTLIPQIFVFAIDGEDQEIVIVRMTGKMDETDIADIIKQQQQ